MVQSIVIEKVTLYELEQTFGLQQVEDRSFFSEWQEILPGLTLEEQQRLDRVRSAYANLERRSMLENTVKLAVVAPLLDLAGFFLPPFYVDTEKEVQIMAEDESLQLRGRIDVLVLKEQFWVPVIEAKRAGFSLKVDIPQALAYMLKASISKPMFGLVTNGSSFMFLKLVRQEKPLYARSKEFLLNQDQGLEKTLQIMKRLADVIAID
ncbi:MAG: restriction endonuclease subunit R [Phormidium tanganyikae FI6-MK23]|jgi:predicted type IV restriction endonuclease|nr:restriction endonuclease subunit R [Phormidium tanganyikae FI6-MK23]